MKTILLTLLLSLQAFALQATKSKLLISTPGLSTLSYTSADQMGPATELPDAVAASGGYGTLLSVSVVDKDKQSGTMYVHLFSDKPTVSSVDNAALDISDSEMAAKYLGTITIPAADYVTLASNTAVVETSGILVKGLKSGNNLKGTSLWYVLEAGQSLSHAIDGVTLNFGVLQD